MDQERIRFLFLPALIGGLLGSGLAGLGLTGSGSTLLRLGEGLRALSLSGWAGNLAAWAVVLRCWLRGRAPATGIALLSYFVQSLFGIGTCFVLPLAAILCGLTVSEDKNALT